MFCNRGVTLSYFGCFLFNHGDLEMLYRCCFVMKNMQYSKNLKANFPKNVILHFFA